MATVYLAVQESLSRHVALKVMNRFLVADQDFRDRFLNEGRLVAKLSHPNVVTVHDIGVSGGVHYLSMTYLPGGTLKESIEQGLALNRALSVFRCLCDALAYAHGCGIIHRDLKPGNILFNQSGDPVLTDFGIAKLVGTDSNLTSTGMAIGSVGYMSPEQAIAGKIDHRSDLYSLGVLFWQMLTGNLPYTATDPFAVALKHAKEPIPKLPERLSAFQPVIETAMAKDPADRPATANELARMLDEISWNQVRRKPIAAPEETLVLSGIPRETSTGAERATQPGNPPVARRSRLPVWISALAVVVALVVVVGYFFQVDSPARSPLSGEIGVSSDAKPNRSSPGDAVGPASASSPTAGSSQRTVGSQSATSEEGNNVRSGQKVDVPLDVRSGVPGAADTALKIDELLRQADEQWNAGRLIEPPGGNAFETYTQVLELDEKHAVASQKLMQIGRINAANKMFSSAENFLRQGAVDDARRMIETGLKMNPRDERLLGLQRALDY
jgi:serine/threonine protein kinase